MRTSKVEGPISSAQPSLQSTGPPELDDELLELLELEELELDELLPSPPDEELEDELLEEEDDEELELDELPEDDDELELDELPEDDELELDEPLEDDELDELLEDDELELDELLLLSSLPPEPPPQPVSASPCARNSAMSNFEYLVIMLPAYYRPAKTVSPSHAFCY